MATPDTPQNAPQKQESAKIRRRTVLLLVVGAVTFFAFGWLAQSLLNKEPSKGPLVEPAQDAGPAEPVLLFDASIDLLDGKELRLDLPDKPQVGTP